MIYNFTYLQGVVDKDDSVSMDQSLAALKVRVGCWLVCRFVFLVGWLAGCSVCWCVRQLTGWQVSWLIVQLVGHVVR